MALAPNPKETAMSQTIDFATASPEAIEAFLTKGHGADRLRHVFNVIQGADNWKAPIREVLTPSVVSISEEEILAAIDFMAGGGGNIEVLPNGDRLVTAPGYYAQIGA